MENARKGTQQAQRGRRSRSRLRVRLPARMETRTDTSRVILVDLSTTGARVLIDNQNLPRIGTETLLHWDKYEAFGEVVWAEGVHCGISFFDPIPEQDVLATRELHDAAQLPQDRELLRQAARHWVEGATRL